MAQVRSESVNLEIAMNLRLKPTESPGQAVRRVCRQHVDQALANLERAHQPEGVHEVRKEIEKRARHFPAHSRQPEPKRISQDRQMMRLAAKPLAASRDARVTRKAFASLVGPQGAPVSKPPVRFEDVLPAREPRLQSQDFGALTRFIFKKAGGRLDDLKPNQAGWVELKACLKKSYARGRDAGELARRRPEPDHFHEWRKQVKNLWYQLDFLCPDWPTKTKVMLQGLEELGEQLGDEHDLVLLESFVVDHAELSQEAAALQVLIDSQRSRFGERVRQLGARLYASLPDLFCGQLEQDWSAWRKRQAH